MAQSSRVSDFILFVCYFYQHCDMGAPLAMLLIMLSQNVGCRHILEIFSIGHKYSGKMETKCNVRMKTESDLEQNVAMM